MLVGRKRTRVEIGAEIKRLRKENNMTQVSLGMKVHVDSAKISRLELGTDTALDTILLMDICEVLHTTMERVCYEPVGDEREIMAEEAYMIIMNAENSDIGTAMKMLRAL